MIISVVNANRKDLMYVIADSTPELNLPTINDDKKIVIKNKFSGKTHLVTPDELKMLFPYVLTRYNIFIKRLLNKEYNVSDEIVNDSLSQLNQMLLDFTDKMTTIRFKEEGQVEFNKTLEIVFGDLFFDVEGIRFPTVFRLSSYSKDEFNSLTDNEIDQLIDSCNKKMNFYILKYATEIIDLNMPDIEEFKHLDFDFKDIQIPDIPMADFSLDFPEFDFLKDLEDVNFNTEKLNKLSIEIPKKFNEINDEVKRLESEISDLKIVDKIRRFANISFKVFDEVTKTPIKIDDIKINDKFIDRNLFTYRESKKSIIYSFKGEVTNPYKISFVKKGYKEVSLTLKSKYDTSAGNVTALELPDIYMYNIGKDMLFTLSWGKIPEDLDFHVYSFSPNFVQIEHAYFNQKRSNLSEIYLDSDDTTSFGPEHVQIFNLNKKFYYLFAVHNYSLMMDELDRDLNMNPENKANVVIQFHGKKLSIKLPDKSERNYWLDAFVIHDEKFYILNSFASNLRSKRETFDFNKNNLELTYLAKKIKNAEQIISFDELKKSSDL